MADESYGIMPFSEIQSLKKDISEIKAQGHSTELASSLERISRTLEGLLHIFKAAAEDMEEDGREGGEHKPIIEKLDEILDQNRTIAEGMVAMSEIIRKQAQKPEPREPLMRQEPLLMRREPPRTMTQPPQRPAPPLQSVFPPPPSRGQTGPTPLPEQEPSGSPPPAPKPYGSNPFDEVPPPPPQ